MSSPNCAIYNADADLARVNAQYDDDDSNVNAEFAIESVRGEYDDWDDMTPSW